MPHVRGAFLAAVQLTAVAGLAQTATTVRSPDGRNAVALALGPQGRLSYRVSHGGHTVIDDSPLGLRCTQGDFAEGLALEAVRPLEVRKERYRLFAGVRADVDQVHRRRSAVFRNAKGARLAVDLDAGNEGVAFRYRLLDAAGTVQTITGELTGFRVPVETRAWLQPYGGSSSYSPAYEEYYYAVRPGDPPPEARCGPGRGWHFPALFDLPAAGVWALIAESGTDGGYCGCHLSADSADGLYRIEFPFPDEATPGHVHPPTTAPSCRLPWTLPWRAILLADAPGDLVTSTLITDLAPPSVIGDTSWIRPGRASWSWWRHPDEQPTADLYTTYVRLARRLGWEYTLLDAGWWQTDTSSLAALAERGSVRLLLWTAAQDFYDPARRATKLDELARAGAAGVKVDFWCSDRQETLAAITETLREAAERRLVVNLHGCTVPRGWQRTYPNLLTAEAVLGSESYWFDADFPERAAYLNTMLPFTRNAVGPVDYTPLALSPTRYARRTTAAHELALAVVLTSGLIHYADGPEVYDAFPEAARAVLRDAPAQWDETRCLVGEPGRCVVMARRAGQSWFLAGLNGTDQPLTLRLPLAAFHRYPRRVLIDEGTDPLMRLRASPVAAAGTWEHLLPPRGGFVLRLDRPAQTRATHGDGGPGLPPKETTHGPNRIAAATDGDRYVWSACPGGGSAAGRSRPGLHEVHH